MLYFRISLAVSIKKQGFVGDGGLGMALLFGYLTHSIRYYILCFREGDFGDSFHLYQVEWTATYIR